jgi:hypothetical protein
MYIMSMLPSKVMPYLLRLAAPLTDSSIVQMKTYKGKVFFFNWLQGSGHAFFGSCVLSRMASLYPTHLELSVKNIHPIQICNWQR